MVLPRVTSGAFGRVRARARPALPPCKHPSEPPLSLSNNPLARRPSLVLTTAPTAMTPQELAFYKYGT